jgi:predicted nucleotide-binding protein
MTLDTEMLAREFERLQKEYFDEVDSHFARQDKARGSVAFEAWEQRFLSFIEREAPSLVQIYQRAVQRKQLIYTIGSPIHGTWKYAKGDAIEAVLTQAILDARAGRLVGNVISSQKQESNSIKKIFIGHGRASAWRDLKDFLQDRLHLAWDEFNRESAAGITTKERLEEMLNQANFAFLVLTAEDEHPDGTIHARENVIHEAGLFQGKLGFQKAILLLEEGCTEFSNIHGLTQIRFPKGNILAKSEDIRRVLERERLLK